MSEIIEDLPRLGIENPRGASGLTAFNFVRTPADGQSVFNALLAQQPR